MAVEGNGMGALHVEGLLQDIGCHEWIAVAVSPYPAADAQE